MTHRRPLPIPMQKRAGAKGFGLFAAEPIKSGQFIIEYVGEVLEEDEYLRRKDFYQEVGQRHYYFMNIGNGEVIDACRKVRKGGAGPRMVGLMDGDMREEYERWSTRNPESGDGHRFQAYNFQISNIQISNGLPRGTRPVSSITAATLTARRKSG